MKKAKLVSAVLLLMIILGACSSQGRKTDDIYSKIHDLYYDMGSYNARCCVSVFNSSSENTYECNISYNKNTDTYEMISDDMKIVLSDEKTIITKGQNTIESPSLPEDMYIFVNSFFKSYYQSEDTSLSVNANEKSNTVLLECSAQSSLKYVQNMRLWLSRDTAMPQKMQLIGDDGNINTEIVFEEFKFTDSKK